MAESHPELEPLLSPEDIDNTPVFPIIHMIRSDVVICIDAALPFEALIAPDITYSLVRPLVEKYSAIQRQGNLSVVFCLLLNRVYFFKDENLSTSNVSRTRGMFCEILAMRVLRDIGADMYLLAVALVTSWPVYNGTDPEVITQAKLERDDDLECHVGNAVELAILGKARKFIKSSACQKIIKAIWSGKCVYQAQSSHSILSDTYKRNPIHFYDPHKAPLLDHYRLKVPAIRSVLEYTNFLILFILFIIAIEYHELDYLNVPEILFMVYALGFGLEKIAAMQEHGIKVYFNGTWNGFDVAFVTIYFVYAILRLYGIYHHKLWACELGIDFLAITATLMFPRLAFVTLENNLMVLSLRAMFIQFLFLMLIAIFCFCGFAYGLWTLSLDGPRYAPQTIAWWMSYLYFGLDATGFAEADKFHPLFGPILWITYGCLSNTLLTTVLVSILSNTFARINEDAEAETMFRKAVSTIEGVKADFFFSYQPPINVLVLCIMLPARYLLNPRWFHKVNVFMIRVTNFPILLLIALYERQTKKAGTTSFYDTLCHMGEKVICVLPRPLTRLSFHHPALSLIHPHLHPAIFEGLAGSGADIEAIFEIGEEYNSALDTSDSNQTPDTRLRFFRTISLDPSPQKLPMQSGHRPPSPTPLQNRTTSRLRLDSSHSRPMIQPQNFASPLAQMYPSVVESVLEGLSAQSDSQDVPTDESRARATGISSAQPTRRRMTNTQSLGPKNRVASVPTGRTGGIDSETPRKSSTPTVVGVPRRKSSASLSSREKRRSTGFMKGPEQLVDTEEREEPATASGIKTAEDGIDPFDSLHWDKRLQEIERRQARIEELLESIAARI